MSVTRDLDDIDRDLDAARDDAFAYGAGWLMVDQNGRIRRVSPPEVAAWAERVSTPPRNPLIPIAPPCIRFPRKCMAGADFAHSSWVRHKCLYTPYFYNGNRFTLPEFPTWFPTTMLLLFASRV